MSKCDNNIVLDSSSHMFDFVEQFEFPKYLSDLERSKMLNEVKKATLAMSEEEAKAKCEPQYYMDKEKVLSGFKKVETKDNDRRKRTKKVSLRIIAGKEKSQSLVISEALYKKLGSPKYVSFAIRDSVLAIGVDFGNCTQYKVKISHQGYIVNSKSLVEFLCTELRLLDHQDNMTTNLRKPFKTAFTEYTCQDFRNSNGSLSTIVFMFIPPGR